MEEVFERRYAPSRPFRLGTRRRRANNARGLTEPGASRSRSLRAHSLDTDNLLATSDSEWLKSQLTEKDLYRQSLALHSELLSTYLKIFQKYASEVHNDPELLDWWQEYQLESRPLSLEETPTERYKRVEKWMKANKPAGANAEAVRWEKKWSRLQHCQMEWMAYRSECCGERTRSVAVPIGCNDRLCPVCAWHRSKNARIKVKQLYDRLTHPVMLTFTIPNLADIRKKYIHHFRKMVRAWLKQYAGRIDGGIYSIETTFNREERTWHLHAHVLANFLTPLPQKADGKVDFYGEQAWAFTKMKWEMEFDWLNLSKDAWIKMPKPERPAKKGIKKWATAWSDYQFMFEKWVQAKRDHSTVWAKFWNGRKYELRRDLTPAQYERYLKLERWNAKNTRVFHLRPVDDRDEAVKEVLKYLTKGAQFSDMPDQVEQFSRAVAGARLVQTFGTWYGLKLDTTFDPEHLDDWGEMKCACGLNMWLRIGVVFRRDVAMDDSGQWHLKKPLEHIHTGTVPRPTIRALEQSREREDDDTWTQQQWERR